jgi:hypothetical protein
MTAADEWLKENAIECTRYRLRLSPHACKACQMATPERCEGCERTKEQPQLTPRQAQHRRGALNAVKARKAKKMTNAEMEEMAPVGAQPLDRATEDDQGAARCAPTSKARRIEVKSEWRGGLRQALREIAEEAVIMDADPRIVRLVRCCHYLAEQVAARDEAGAMEVFEEASEILGR